MTKIKIHEIRPFKNHPYQVNEDHSLSELVISIKQNGLLNPVIVRKKENYYELISGHRRLKAMDKLGEIEIDATIKELTDEEATILMVDSNLQREMILPSEKAFAYKMKSDALKKQGKEDLCPEVTNNSPRGNNKEMKDNKRQMYRYIRLTYLIPEILQMVDDKLTKDKNLFLTMGIKPGIELSYLTKDEQRLVYSEMVYENITPSHAQTIKIRELSKKKELNAENLEDILLENKGNQNEKISFNKEKINASLPNDMKNRDKRYIEEYIIKAIDYYEKHQKIKREKEELDF
ncbi:MAG: ParB/RepB/Spo0J family partition protein [Bacilli bacterium]|nr:ParB/RepB/Spo0J family partition protein [Bacilli bacterium]